MISIDFFWIKRQPSDCTSSTLGNDKAATRAINDMLIEEGHGGMVFGSPETARRVFGNKTK